MKTRAAVISALCLICATAVIHKLRATTMPEIKFEIGKNILETAKNSGAPRYSTRNVAGLVSYGLVNLSENVPARFTMPGYEIEAIPLFAFTLYADEKQNNGLAVEAAVLQFSTDSVKSHESGKAFVEALLSQFKQGKWQRYFSDYCPAVTGRSSFLNEAGERETSGTCPLDPHHRLSMEDWLPLMRMTQRYQWIGEGVLASLDVGYSDDIRGITYNIDLEFENLAIKERRNAENVARELAEGDQLGWNSTENERKDTLARKALVKVLEENATKRGDKVIQR